MILGPILGTGLHAIGGMAASTCYTPFEKTKQWSWVSFWLVQALFAWLLVPLILGILTVPDFFTILLNSPPNIVLGAFLLGALYGFGGMSFGLAITHIGYSLTYTISIGISAVLGTIIPLITKTLNSRVRGLMRNIAQVNLKPSGLSFACGEPGGYFTWL